MSDESLLPTKMNIGENPLLVAIFRLVVPGLLGGIMAYLATISSAQRDQGKQLADITGTLKVFTQINSDVALRLNKVEQQGDQSSSAIAALNGRVLVLEAERAPPPK